MSKLRAGIIGTGGISQNHIEGYLARPDEIEVAAVCDIDADKLAKYAKRYGVEHTYTDCREMMARERLDMVSVTTWNSAHKDCTLTALNAGANVICEKPMAINAAEAVEMRDCAKKNGKLLQIGFVRRFGNDAQTVLDFKNAGLMGDIYYARVQYLRRSGCPGSWFRDKNFSGGGPLIDLGVHIIDLARYLAGCPQPVSAYGATFSNLGPNRAGGGEEAWKVDDLAEHPYNVEDMATAMVKFDNGFTLQAETSFNLNIPRDHTEIDVYGTKSGVKIGDELEFYSDTAGKFIDIRPMGDNNFDFHNAFRAEMNGFIDAVKGEAPCRAGADDGVALMKIIDAIYESARTGRSVDIK